jgi:hypothetical protein
MSYRSIIADWLSSPDPFESANQSGTQEKTEYQRRKHPTDCTKREVAEYIKRAVFQSKLLK